MKHKTFNRTSTAQELYVTPHDHKIYGHGHHLRVEITKVLAHANSLGMHSVADLSCGNGHIAKSLGFERTILGDYAPGYRLHGPIEETIEQIDHVDLFICSETIEHLVAPGAVLVQIRPKATKLVLSTPIEAWKDTNGEHLWAWDREYVESMAEIAGWTPEVFASLDSLVFGEPYLYGIWVFH